MHADARRGTAGFAHVSCLAEQAKILVAEAERTIWTPRRKMRGGCGGPGSLCEQDYHGVVKCALGWACWKTLPGPAGTDQVHGMAMNQLGNGLYEAGHYADALSVQEADLSMKRHLGALEVKLLASQTNLARTYHMLGRLEEASSMWRDIYFGWWNLDGKENGRTLNAASNYSASLVTLERFKEAKSLLRKMMPVAQRALGAGDIGTLRMRTITAVAFTDDDATLDDLHEAEATLEDTERITRRVLSGAHPLTSTIEDDLQTVRAALAAREMQTTTLMSETAPLPPGWSAGNRLATGETEEQLMARLRREATEINAAVAREAAEAKARLRNELPGYDEPD